MVETSPFGAEGEDVELSPELAAFEAELARSRGVSSPGLVEVAGREPSSRFETEGGVAKTHFLTPVELAVELAAQEPASAPLGAATGDSSPTLWSAPPPSFEALGEPKREPSPTRSLWLLGAVGVTLAVACAALLGWMLS